MITILHIIPTLEGGGAERQLAMIAKEQVKRGWNVHIGLRRMGVNGQLLANSGVSVHLLGDLKSLNPMLFLTLFRLIRQIKPDIVQTWLTQMDIVGGFVALRCSIDWVMTERNSAKLYLETPFFEWLRKSIAKYAKAIVANSQQGALYWRINLPFLEQIYTIQNAVDVAAIKNSPVLVKESLNIKNDFLLSVGRLVPEKAHDLIIRAISLLPNNIDPQVYIIGKGPLHQDLEKLVSEYRFEDRVSILPFQPDWWRFLKSASVLVSMSRFEGSPNVLLEAMAAGCPLIVSDIPEHREILDDNSALFVPEDNIEALAAAIELLLSNKLAAEARALNASAYVENLKIETVVDAYSQVYATVLNRSVIECVE